MWSYQVLPASQAVVLQKGCPGPQIFSVGKDPAASTGPTAATKSICEYRNLVSWILYGETGCVVGETECRQVETYPEGAPLDRRLAEQSIRRSSDVFPSTLAELVSDAVALLALHSQEETGYLNRDRLRLLVVAMMKMKMMVREVGW